MRLAVALALWLVATTARADWLLYAPECSFDAEAYELAHTALLYPRPFLPAVVRAGEPLIVRIRTASALTPPPGIQREKALYGWSASIDGDAIAIDQASLRYDLRVADVRPDGPFSMIYRVRLPIPRYAAPGTYSLRVTAPGGTDVMPASVRIVAPESAIRIGRIGRTSSSRALAVLARLPVDVWLAAPGSVPIDARSPIVLGVGEGAAAAVIATDRAMTLASCGEAFDREADAFARQAELPLSRFSLSMPPPDHYAIGDAIHPMPAGDEIAIAQREDRIDVTAPMPIEIAIVYPERVYALRSDTTFDFHPAHALVHASARSAIVARASGTSIHASLVAPRPVALDLNIDPWPAPSGRHVTLQAITDRETSLIAWQLDEDASAIGSTLRTRLRHAGRHRIPVVAIARDGSAARRTLELPFEPTIMHGCAISPRPRDVLPRWALLLLSLLLARGLMRTTKYRSMIAIALLAVVTGCAHNTIPNTDVDDTSENRDVLTFVERYRHAVEERDIAQMIAFASERYFDDNGTPIGDDDIDYRNLRLKLAMWRERVLDVRYEIRYRRVNYDQDRVFVDYTYTGSYLVQTPDGERWQRRLRDNRLVLRKGGESYRILSGM